MALQKLIDRIRHEFKTRKLKVLRGRMTNLDGCSFCGMGCIVGAVDGNYTMGSVQRALDQEGINLSIEDVSHFMKGWDGIAWVAETDAYFAGRQLREELDVN